MEDEDKTVECQDSKPSTGTSHTASVHQGLREERVVNLKDGNEPTEDSNLLNSGEGKPQELARESSHLQSLRRILACPPHGWLSKVITNGTMVVLLWAVVWSVTGPECLPGGNLFGIIILFYCAVTGGKMFGLIKFPTLPPLPPLLGMLLAGFLLRNVPAISDNVRIQQKWSSSLRSIALSVILVRAGLGLDPKSEVEKIIAVTWDVFQPLLFGLIGAEVSIASLRPETVGICVATLGTAVLIRILTTFLMVCFAGFNIKEKIFISFAWLPKATVQAAIGSVALDTARTHGEKQLEKYGMDVLTVAFLSILITAPIGSLLIGLLGPRLLQKFEHQNEEEVQGETSAHVQRKPGESITEA